MVRSVGKVNQCNKADEYNTCARRMKSATAFLGKRTMQQHEFYFVIGFGKNAALVGWGGVGGWVGGGSQVRRKGFTNHKKLHLEAFQWCLG